MKFFIPTHGNEAGIDLFGVVDVHDQLRKWLLKQHETFKELKNQEDDLYELVYWDDVLEWHEMGEGLTEEDAAALESNFDADEVALLPGGFRMDSDQPRVELCRIVIDERGVHWRCVPKHTDVEIISKILHWVELEDAKRTTPSEETAE